MSPGPGPDALFGGLYSYCPRCSYKAALVESIIQHMRVHHHMSLEAAREEMTSTLTAQEAASALGPRVGQPGPHVGASGATSSELRPAYADCPRSFWRRLGLRFGLGQKLHGRGNWLRAFGIEGRSWDEDWLRDRYNHALDHLLAFQDEGSNPDDHLAAVAWFCALAMQAEEHGLDWPSVLRVRTPEAKEESKPPGARLEATDRAGPQFPDKGGK